MVKVELSDDNSATWFFVAANSEVEMREMVEDSTSRIVEFTTSPNQMADNVRTEFDHVALITNI